MRVCKLCLLDKPLVASHLLPAAVYALMRNPAGPVVDPVYATPERAISTSAQIRGELLCTDCEGLFSDRGESWVLKRCYRGAGDFALYESVIKSPIIESNSFGSLYATAANPLVDTERLAYFAMSIFWRTSVWRWDKGSGRRPIDFGRGYSEQIRLFLLGLGSFPIDAALLTLISHPAKAAEMNMTYIPTGGRSADRTQHTYNFHIPGVFFSLALSSRLTPASREMCLINNQDAPIYEAESVSNSVIQNVWKSLSGTQARGKLRRLSAQS